MGELKYFFLDLLFPRRCLGCAELLADLSDCQLCAICPTTIKLKTDFACAFCSAPVLAGQTCPFCLAMRDPAQRDGRLHYLDYLLVTTSYETPLVEKLLKTLKYKFIRSLADPAASLMIKYLEKFMSKSALFDFGSPIVVPVPLHRRRLHWRGFNQSELIAEQISRHFGWPLVNALERKKNNRPQAEIADRLARIQNLSGSFFCPRPELVSGKVVLLIDDVSTTGSTLDDCARALQGAGTTEVIGLVFARGK